MKKVLLSLIVLIPLFSFTDRETISGPMKVVIDCTGTYLQKDGKDYHVCNIEMVNEFTDGESVTASFVRIEPCTGEAIKEYRCKKLHPDEGWIEVKEIKSNTGPEIFNGKMMVVINCTGIYLKLEGKFYKVCNIEKLEGLVAGQNVTASFIKIRRCFSKISADSGCEINFPNEGFIEVKEIQ